jgi:hypothetical protein
MFSFALSTFLIPNNYKHAPIIILCTYHHQLNFMRVERNQRYSARLVSRPESSSALEGLLFSATNGMYLGEPLICIGYIENEYSIVYYSTIIPINRLYLHFRSQTYHHHRHQIESPHLHQVHR